MKDNLIEQKFETWKKTIVPKSLGQKSYFEALNNYELVFGLGPAGTGKSYLAVAKGIDLLKKGGAVYRRYNDEKSPVESKVLFLDIDGVVQTNTPGQISQQLLEHIKTIVDQSKCSIVLSSDWRRSPQGCDAVRRSLRLKGLDFLDHTPLSR